MKILYFLLGVITCAILGSILMIFNIVSIDQEISLEINPLDLVTAAISVYLAIYITNVLNKRNESLTSSKKYFIDHLNGFQLNLNTTIESILLKKLFNHHSTISDLKILRQKLNFIRVFANTHNLIPENDTSLHELNSLLGDIWAKLTDGTLNTELEMEVHMRTQEINKLLIEFNSMLLELIFKINIK